MHRASTPAPSGEDKTARWQLSPGAAVTSISARFAPALPTHGKRFALVGLTTTFADGTTGTAAATCTAALAGRRLPASCGWNLPANARGKKLVVRVRGAGLSRVYTLSVR
jgi:hypothetical protein